MVEEDFKEGYRKGFADGYKAAMSELIEKREEKIVEIKKEMEKPDFDPRWWFWPW